MMACDGKTLIEDPDEFGQEWQAYPTDTRLFHIINGPQYPARCNVPEQPHLCAMSKKVRGEEAKRACAGAFQNRPLFLTSLVPMI